MASPKDNNDNVKKKTRLANLHWVLSKIGPHSRFPVEFSLQTRGTNVNPKIVDPTQMWSSDSKFPGCINKACSNKSVELREANKKL